MRRRQGEKTRQWDLTFSCQLTDREGYLTLPSLTRQTKGRHRGPSRVTDRVSPTRLKRILHFDLYRHIT